MRRVYGLSDRIDIEFVSRDKQRSKYDWANIEFEGERVGKARCFIDGESLTIFSINIYPEFKGRGFGSEFIEEAKKKYTRIVADRVRQTAIGFWEKMGFDRIDDNNWVYQAREYEK